MLSVRLSDFICSPILRKSIRLLRLNLLYITSLYRVWLYIYSRNVSFADYILACVTKTKSVIIIYGINISNIWNPSSQLSRVHLAEIFDFLFFICPCLDWPSSRLIHHPLKYVHDDPYDISLEFIARRLILYRNNPISHI